MHKLISSAQNPAIKRYLQLSEKSRERRKSGQFVIEGVREIQMALKAGYQMAKLFHCPAILATLPQEIQALECGHLEVTTEVYAKMAYRSATEGLLAIGHAKELDLKALRFDTPKPLILVAEAPEKPGNIGALLRTADAADVDAVILANPRTDWYNPNIIRSSVGTVFTNQLAAAPAQQVIDYLKEQGVAIYSAILQDAVSYLEVDYSKAAAIVVGTEATGLSKEWRTASEANIIIPMEGAIDSMNVSVAAGILIFEAKRQRKKS